FGSLAVTAQVDAVRLDQERCVDVVVHDEGRAELAKRACGLHELVRARSLPAELDHGRAARHSRSGRLDVLHEHVQPHSSLALLSSFSGSSSASRRREVSVRYLVAPAPTGSSTTGTRFRFAARPASSIASTQSSESVPMLSTRAEAAVAISSTSWTACAITGSAPSASVALAVSFMTT